MVLFEVFDVANLLATSLEAEVVDYLAVLDGFISEYSVFLDALFLHVVRVQVIQELVLVLEKLFVGHHHIVSGEWVEEDFMDPIDRHTHLASVDVSILDVENLVDTHADPPLQSHLDVVRIHDDRETQPIVGLDSDRVTR